jgi:hypothetical protein
MIKLTSCSMDSNVDNQRSPSPALSKLVLLLLLSNIILMFTISFFFFFCKIISII